MKWLINTRSGRFYLIVQIVCLVATSSFFLKFYLEDRESEKHEIDEWKRLNRIVIQDGYGWVLPTKAERPQMYDYIEHIEKEHANERLKKLFTYLWPNLTILPIFGCGMFILYGMPKRKPTT